MANLTYSIIARSCSKIMIGKTYWKSFVLLEYYMHHRSLHGHRTVRHIVETVTLSKYVTEYEQMWTWMDEFLSKF